jgi:hypothetical protein
VAVSDPAASSRVTPDTGQMIPRLLALLGDDACLLHPRAGYDDGPGGNDFDCAVQRIDHQWPLRITGVRVCQCIRHGPVSWYWVVKTSDDVVAIDATDDPLGIGPLSFPTTLAIEGGPTVSGVRAAFLTMKRLRKGNRKPQAWDGIVSMASRDPRIYAKCLQNCLGTTLGRAISRSVLAGRVPGIRTWRRAVAALRLRRVRTPKRVVVLFLRSLERLADRVGRPTGLTVAVVGPDGTGKSTLASALSRSCDGYFWRTEHIHWRPGLLPSPGALVRSRRSDPEHPHEEAPHGRMLSVGMLLYYWLDFLFGSWFGVMPLRIRSALIVVERGWWDIAVDPRRYRMLIPRSLVIALGRFLPRPDITFVLEAPASVALQRKREISASEIQRQMAEWRKIARARRSYVRVDASVSPSDVLAYATEQVVSFLERRTLARTGPGWLALTDRGSVRWMIPRGARNAAVHGLGIYQPVTLKGKLGWQSARAAAMIGLLRWTPRGEAPPALVRQAMASRIPPRGTIAVMRANHRARFVALILDESGGARAIAKLAFEDAGRKALHREAEALVTAGGLLPPPLRAPKLLEHEDGLLLLEAVDWRLRRRPWQLSPQVALALGRFYAAGRSNDGRGPAHGDFAPWNLLEVDQGWVAIDWEASRVDAPPFFDLFHYLVQSCALLGRPSANAIVRGLTVADGMVASLVEAYRVGAGLGAADPRDHFLEYLLESGSTLDPASPDGRAGLQLREELRRQIRQHP